MFHVFNYAFNKYLLNFHTLASHSARKHRVHSSKKQNLIQPQTFGKFKLWRVWGIPVCVVGDEGQLSDNKQGKQNIIEHA